MLKRNNRDDFTSKTKKKLAERVSYICSNPFCKRGTIGPSSNNSESVSTGVAAHICAAAPGGKRYKLDMNFEERSDIENGIWLCQSCSKLIDSDENKYTVEVLKKWKEETEYNISNSLVVPIYELTSREKSIIYISQPILNEQVLNDAKNEHENYSEMYKDYIGKFKELEDYIFNENFSNIFGKKFEFDNEILNFGKEILDWMMGTCNFPIEGIDKFYKNLIDEYSLKDNAILSKRWQAIKLYFEGDLNSAQNIYEDILVNIKSANDLPNWFVDDILIDGRNILIQNENKKNIFSFNNIFQDEISKNTHKLSYPSVDRVKADLYEKVLNRLFDFQNKSKFSKIYGIGLEYIFNSIQELIYVTILYGSITHLNLVRKLFAEVIAIYANYFEDEKFYKLTLTQLILSGDFKNYKKMYYKIRDKYRFVDEIEYINSVLELKKSIIPFDLSKYNIFIYDVYGRYLKDEYYEEYEENIIKYIEIDKESNISLIDNALESIPNNIDRFINKEKLFDILNVYIDKKYSRFYIRFEPILSNIKIEELSPREQETFIKLVDKCLKLKEIDINYAMISIKKHLPTYTKYDEIIFDKNNIVSLIYNLNKGNYVDSLKFLISKISSRVEEREIKPFEHCGYAQDFAIGNEFFIKPNYNSQIKSIVKYDILPLSEKILFSDKQYAKDKIKILKTLIYIINIEDEHEIIKEIDSINQKVIKKSATSEFIDEYNEADIEVYIIMILYLLKKITFYELLLKYLMLSIKDPNTINSVMSVLEIIRNKIDDDQNNNLEILYALFCIAANSDDLEISNYSIIFSGLFINTDYWKEIVILLEEVFENPTYSQTSNLVELWLNLSKSDRFKLKNIKAKLLKSSNYNIKYIANKYLK